MYINKKKAKINLVISFLISFISLAFNFGCNDLPTNVGYSFINDTITVHSISTKASNLITSAIPYYEHQSLLSPGMIALGKSGDYKAVIMERFIESSIPDSLAYLKPEDVISCELYLQPLRYAYGDTTNTLNESSSTEKFKFTVLRTIKLFTVGVDWDSLYPGGTNISPYFDYHKTLGTYDGKIVLKDTMPFVKVSMDPSIFLEWFKMKADSVLMTEMFGFGIIPDENNNVIHEFSATEIGVTLQHPLIRMLYKNKNGVTDSVFLYSAMDFTVVNRPPYEKNTITVQGMTTYKTELAFNVDTIPPWYSIQSAELQLTIDDSRSKYGNMPRDTVLRADLAVKQGDHTTFETQRYYLGSRAAGTNTYTFPNIASALEIWIHSQGKGSLLLRPSDFAHEIQRLDRQVFYGPDEPDSTKRPKLKVIYTSRPKVTLGK
jgi:hypothetical protein